MGVAEVCSDIFHLYSYRHNFHVYLLDNLLSEELVMVVVFDILCSDAELEETIYLNSVPV